MRKAIALAAGAAVLAFINYGIYRSELLVTKGEVVYLKLSPVDPRSMMQGDYMRLSFEASDKAFPRSRGDELADGQIVVGLDKLRVGQFRRFADARPLASDEIALRYRIRAGRANFATNAFFFEEGQAETYGGARYGEFRVAEDGDMILTGLRGAGLELLKPARPVLPL